MHDAILRHAVLDGDAREPVDFDGDKPAPARNINAEALVVEQRREVDMVVARRRQVLDAVLAVVGVRVQRLVDDGVVLEQGLEVAESLLRVEEEGVGGRP
jgi:hypothetical protein